jgi:ferric-dicitrate binding protein FerR (iron transport regulator)
MNTQFEDLLGKHLNVTLNDEEKKLLGELLQQPENQLYLASKMDQEFFDEVAETAADDKTGHLIFQRIRQRIASENGQTSDLEHGGAAIIPMPWHRRRLTRWIAAAASIILIISFGVLLSGKKQNESVVTAPSQPNVEQKSVAVFRHESNTTGKEKTVQLPDGSTVVMADKSEISYREPFTDKRDITLIGKAYFKVAKDKTRPFTVFSNNLSTTALGTEFTVTAQQNTSRIMVRLYEGKVVIRSLEKSNKMKDVFLLPGQEFVYDLSARGTVGKFAIGKTRAPGQILQAETIHDDPSIPQEEGSWYMFNNQSLAVVFDQLAEMYNAEIDYNKADVQNIYFIGKFDKSDSLEAILKRIGTLNNLKITKTGAKFIVNK